ncbi:MAG: type III-B CRISPR module RAMP protein Cmr4 [Candidatus Polarisedimenticolaceae bacterium]|nr:type III-B CRISPR module RAMP protein Cmr4 [Candidatus Polarisedimenticolaceae bacterium]
MKTHLYHIHALTALHAGTGQGVGVIDLPIAREKSTGLPIIPGSGMKGVLREELRPEESDEEKSRKWETLFGPKPGEAASSGGFSGALTIQDALLLCLPVRSIYGVFAWVTSPFILERYKRDLKNSDLLIPKVTATTAIETTTSALSRDNKVYLEDLDLDIDKNSDADQVSKLIAAAVFPNDPTWQHEFKKRLLIVPDDTFSFLAETATEVRTRIRLEEGTRTVAKGALWYEENLPAETLLWGIIGCDRARNGGQQEHADSLMNAFIEKIIPEGEVRLQIGGKATVGRGNVRWLISTEEQNCANQNTK